MLDNNELPWISTVHSVDDDDPWGRDKAPPDSRSIEYDEAKPFLEALAKKDASAQAGLVALMEKANDPLWRKVKVAKTPADVMALMAGVMPILITGLDLGQSQDPSAMFLAKRTMRQRRRYYDGQAIKRWHLGTPYPQIVTTVKKFFARPPYTGSVLAVDYTGVGRPVVDMFRQETVNIGPDGQSDGTKSGPVQARLIPVTITAGSGESWSQSEVRVAKVTLVSTALVVMQQDRLRIADVPERKILIKEFQDFRHKMTTAAHDTYSAVSGANDDILLAASMVLWFGERGQRKLQIW